MTSDRLRVVIVAPLVVPLLPTPRGGTQAMLTDLALGLTAAGSDVEVVAPAGSRVPGVRLHRYRPGPFPGELHSVGPQPPGKVDGWPAAQASAFLELTSRLRADPPDVVHVHAFDWALVYALTASGLPYLQTFHARMSDPPTIAALQAATRCRPRPWFATVSRAAAAEWRGVLPVDAVIANGVDPACVPFGDRPEHDLALIPGRILPEKGTHLALLAAEILGMRALVVGAIDHRPYFEERVRPLLNHRAQWVGAVPRGRLLRLYRHAAVALVASQWQEPFGLVAVEAALAGTPVAAFAAGALPEVVGDWAGAIAPDNTPAGLAHAATVAMALARPRVRAAVASRFSLDRMVQRHIRLYRRLIAHRQDGGPHH